MERGELVEIRVAPHGELVGPVEELLEPATLLLALAGFDTAAIREAVHDPEIHRAALISGVHDTRDRVFVALQRCTGQWVAMNERLPFTMTPYAASNDFPVAGTTGAGFRAWETKRRNKLHGAYTRLKTEPRNTPEQLLRAAYAAHDISECIAVHWLPLSATELPRGYRLVVNRVGIRSLELNGVLFGATEADPLPPEEALVQLITDVETGWFRRNMSVLARVSWH